MDAVGEDPQVLEGKGQFLAAAADEGPRAVFPAAARMTCSPCGPC
jgi:hypothetical protein